MMPPATRLYDLLIVIYWLILILHGTKSETQEVCEFETFEGRCESGQVMVMKSARYGRMRLGRCVKVDLGYLGCSADVLSLFDGWCSGKPSCDVNVDGYNEELIARGKCIAEISSYVEVEYTCTRAAAHDETTCRAAGYATLTADQGTVASHVTDQSVCGGLLSPWVIRTSPGQRVSISMTDFGWTDEAQFSSKCQAYGYIVEPDLGVNHTLCGGLARDRHVFKSSTNHVVMQIIPIHQRQLQSSFLLQYAVIGCPDMRPPENAWYKRNGSTAVIGCEWSEHSWHLKCDANTWAGVVGNCSRKVGVPHKETANPWTMSPLLSVSLIIGLGVLVVALFCIALIGCVCILRSRKPMSQAKPSGFQPTDQQQAFLYHPGRPVPMAHPSQVGGGANIGQSEACTLHLVKPTPTDDLIHIWETPLPIPKQAQSLTGATDNSTTMSGRGTLPGPPQVYKDGSTMSRSDYSTDTYWAGTDRYFDNDLGWVTMPPKNEALNK